MTDILPCVCGMVNPRLEVGIGNNRYACLNCGRSVSAKEKQEAQRMWNAAMSGPKLISMDKKYRTRDGRKVVLESAAASLNRFPVVGRIMEESGISSIVTWTAQGRIWQGKESSDDLVEDTE